MILITRGDARTPGTFLVDIALRERLGQFGNKEFMVFSDTVNYLLTLSRLVNDFKFDEVYNQLIYSTPCVRTKTTVSLTEENHQYLINLTDGTSFKPYHIFSDVVGQALQLTNTYSLDYVVKKKEG